MYAVVKSGGKQLKVAVGETVSVELLDASPGAVVILSALAVNDGDKLIVGEEAANASVTAEVLGHGKADKVMIFKLKKRKGYKRTRGHRQNLTLLKVTDISLAGAKRVAKSAEISTVAEKPAAPKKAAPKKTTTAAKPAAKPAAAKAETTRKPAAVKRPTPKPEAAPKPAVKKAVAKKPAVKKAVAKKPAVKKAAAATVASTKKSAAPKKAAATKAETTKKPAAKKPAVKKPAKPVEPA